MDDHSISTQRSPPLRLNSPVLASYPWKTLVLGVSDFDDVFKVTYLKRVVEDLEQFELLLPSASSGNGLAIRQFLHFERKYTHLPPDLFHAQAESMGVINLLSPQTKSMLVALLLTYRVLDLAALLEGYPELPLKHKRMNNAGEGLKHFDQLHNWPQLFFKLKDSSELVNRPVATAAQNSSKIPSIDRHLRLLSYLLARKARTVVLINVQLAVLALHRILIEGGVGLLEDRTNEFRLNELGTLDGQERQYLSEALKNEKMDLALYFALFVSPLYLLISSSLHKSRNDHFRITLTGKMLGNQRPPLLARVEKELMSLLFRLATQELDLISEMKNFMSGIPWDELRAIEGHPDSFWFKTGCGGNCSLSLSTADAEGIIPPGWAVKQVSYAHLSSTSTISTSLQGTLSLPPPPYVGSSESFDHEQDEGVDSASTRSSAPDVDESQPMAIDNESEMVPNMVEEGVADPHLPNMSTSLPVDEGKHMAVDHESDTAQNERHGEQGVAEAGSASIPTPEAADKTQLMAVDDAHHRADSEGQPLANDDVDDIRQTTMELGEDGADGMVLDSQELSPKKSQRDGLRSQDGEGQTLGEDGEDELGEDGEDELGEDGEDELGEDDEHGMVLDCQDLSPKKPQRNGLRSQHLEPKKRKKSFSPNPTPKKKPKKMVKRSTGSRYPNAGSSINNPIDVDKIFTEDINIDLDLEDNPPKHRGDDIQGYGPKGELFQFVPEVHSKIDLQRLKEFEAAIKEGFVNGEPVHVADPTNSVFSVMTEAEFEEKSVAEILAIIRTKHIVVTDMSAPALEFNGKGLASLTALNMVVDIQDQSVEIDGVELDYNSRHRRGTLRNLLHSSKTNGKVLNALHFPMPEQALGSFPFSTDSVAWNGTKGSLNCEIERAPPIGDIRWGIAATAGAIHWWHVDSDGFGTYVDTKAGLKWWIVGRRKGRLPSNFESFGEIRTFSEEYELEQSNLNIWDLEAVILHPGTRLIMRPNTPHAVFTPSHAICHGGHFYSCSNMQDTMFGLVHTFISPDLLTNTQHTACWGLLRRIAIFYHDVLVKKRVEDDEYELGHIPSLLDIKSVLDLFTFCNIIIFMNVLDARTYLPCDEAILASLQLSEEDILLYDVNAIPPVERLKNAYARGLCIDILQWFFHTYEIYDVQTGLTVNGYSTVAMDYLVHQATAIIKYKGSAKDFGLHSKSGCTVEELYFQFELCFENFLDVQLVKTTASDDDNHLSLAWPNIEKYGVRDAFLVVSHQSPDSFLDLGTTAGDKKFFSFALPSLRK